jgi:uncharacterized protein YfiM (DUF2279 family)
MGNVLKWATDTFGAVAMNRNERAARILEEALELAQAEGVTQETADRLVARVYGRPAGEPKGEYQGLCMTVQAYAELTDDPFYEAAAREYVRVVSRPREEWRARHDAKAAAGVANLSD